VSRTAGALRWALLAATLTACAGTETGNPSFAGELAYNTHASDPAVAALRTSEGGAQVDSAWLVLGDARFVDAAHCERRDEVEFNVQGLGAGDHATPAAAVSEFQLEVGDYCGLELPLIRAAAGELPDDAPAQLEGHSIVIEGEGADGRPFRIESGAELPLFLAADDGSFLMDADGAQVLVGFDVSVWLSDVDLSSATASDDGVVVVSSDSNSGLLDAFEQNLPRGVALFRDPEGQRVVDEAGAELAHGAP
jgi:hypothetical protein